MKNLIGIMVISLLLIGCGNNILNDDGNSSPDQNKDTAQIVIQVKVLGSVSECRDFKNCDTLETLIVYHVGLEDGRYLEVNKATYEACREIDLYPSCVRL